MTWTNISRRGGMSENGGKRSNDAKQASDARQASDGQLWADGRKRKVSDTKRSNEERRIRRLAAYCWRFKRDVIIALGGALLYTAATLTIPLLQRDVIHTGQLVGRSISDINMAQGLLQWMPLIVGSVILFIFSLGIMITLAPLLSLVAIAVAPALWLIASASRVKLFPASWQAQQVVGDVAGIVDEAIGGVRVVKGFGQEEQEMERMEGASRGLFGSRLRMIRL